ncbi:MAG: hypothetical protein JRH18_11150 [Deltaproteobacteria bacterium]|nr:hypothetical protein [Deltaproteobacteria bacterium]MBW2152214.1 hypothetical protein [Deltaproteobacteria bacterium]
MKRHKYRLGIPLLGKGATNHLHRMEVVKAFASRGIPVIFLVREDYLPLLERIPGCTYRAVHFKEITGFRQFLCSISRNIRMRYPFQDRGLRERYRRKHLDNSILTRIINRLYGFFACFRWMVSFLVVLEQHIYRKSQTVFGCDAKEIDQLLLLGIGTLHSELEGQMTWWGIKEGISVVHIVGNYDNLSSNGYRGVPVNRLLVWGRNMRKDAMRIHGIPPERITEIGSIRYNLNSSLLISKKKFLECMGLSTKRKTLLFAGFLFASQYFEMMTCFQEILNEGLDCQLILRVYPNKQLMNSIYMEPLLHYANKFSRVTVSLADPYFRYGERGRPVLQIEEYELWNSLAVCDCVINIFSTISVEACIFDKPVINMWYFPRPTGNLARQPVYLDYSANFHNRRLASYGAIRIATNRQQLKKMIYEALKNPGKLSEQRHRVVKDEVGQLDGQACDRLAEICIQEYHRSVKVTR